MSAGESAEHHELRRVVRDFLRERSPSSAVRRLMEAGESRDDEVWALLAGQLGLTGIAVPERYGGAGYGPAELGIVLEEMGGALLVAPYFATVALAGQALAASGDEDAMARWLPGIADGSLTATLAVGEESGSWSLAEVAATARPAGGGWAVTGAKQFVIDGDTAGLLLVAARAPDGPGVFAVEASAEAITYLVIDARAPGVRVRPLRDLTGGHLFAEVFFDDVRVPAVNRIGEVDDGWRVASASLGHERSGVGARAAELYAQLDGLVELARGTTTADGRPAIADGATRQRLGRLAALAHVTGVMSKAVQSRIAHGTEDAADGPLAKVFFSEVNLAMTEFGVALQGVGGMAVEGDPRACADGWWQDAYLYARAWTIAGGANEVLKTVAAERALGLPRDKR